MIDIGDIVYIPADGYPEITYVVISVDNNKVELRLSSYGSFCGPFSPFWELKENVAIVGGR